MTTLAQKLAKPSFQRFPHIKSSFDFGLNNLSELAINKFGDFREVEFTKSLTVYIGAPQITDEELDNYIVGKFDGIYFIPGKSDAERDKKLGDIRLFISYDGAYLLKQHKDILVQDNEIAIFLEVPRDDLFSDTILLVKAGKNAYEYSEQILKGKFVKEHYLLKEDQVEGLLESLNTGNSLWDKIISTVIEIEDIIIDAGIDYSIFILNELADLFGKTLRIDEKRWNSSHPDNTLHTAKKDIIKFLQEQTNELNTFINKDSVPLWVKNILKIPYRISQNIINALENITEEIEGLWAFICGVWNGLMDLMSGIFSLVELVFKGIRAHDIYKKNEQYYKSLFVEYIDNAIQELLNLDIISILYNGFSNLKDLLKFIFIDIPKQAFNKLSSLNDSEISYYIGYIIFNCIEFIFPVLKLVKLLKVTKLEKVVSFFDEITSTVTNVGKQARKETQEIVEIFFKVIDGFIETLKKGTNEVLKYIDNIFQAIKEWLEKAIGIGRKATASNFNEYSKLYGELVVQGSRRIKRNFDAGSQKITKDLLKGKFATQAKLDYKKYKNSTKIKKKLEEAAYIIRHGILSQNKKVGKLAEDIMQSTFKGQKPKKAIRIGKKKRYVDNFHNGTIREVKSGRITFANKKQIDMDIQILFSKIRFEDIMITKVEWHTLQGIDEVVLKYIQTELKSLEIPQNRFQIYLY